MGSCNNLNHEEALEIIIKIDTLTSLNLVGWKMGSLPEGFEKLTSLEDLSLACCHALAKNEGTFTILSQIPTLTKLSLQGCDMESLPAGIQHPSTVILTSFSGPHPSTLRRVQQADQPEGALTAHE